MAANRWGIHTRLKRSSSDKAFTKRFDPVGRTLRNSSDGCRPELTIWSTP